MHRPLNISKSNTKSNLALVQVHVRTDMLSENPLLQSVDLEADRDVLYLPGTFVLLETHMETQALQAQIKHQREIISSRD